MKQDKTIKKEIKKEDVMKEKTMKEEVLEEMKEETMKEEVIEEMKEETIEETVITVTKRGKHGSGEKLRRWLAIGGIVILVGMYVLTFVAACFARPESSGLFMGSVGATIMIPILLYAFNLVFKVTMGRGVLEQEELKDNMDVYDESDDLNGH